MQTSLISAENLTKQYRRKTFGGGAEHILALNRVSFSLSPGTTLAIVGESGSGKSTLALCMACLERPTEGRIRLDGKDLTQLAEKHLRSVRPQIQLVFQDPAASFNPRWTVLEVLCEPLLLQDAAGRSDLRKRAHALLGKVGLSLELENRLTGELSGGQRQRLAIARALALQPRLLILDEALSALDCSVQAQIANLLMVLQRSEGMTYLFITHDLAMAAHLADEIAVMKQGRIIEMGPAPKITKHPAHEVTKELLAAMPRFSTALEPPAGGAEPR